MLMRGIGAVALTLSLTSGAVAGKQPASSSACRAGRSILTREIFGLGAEMWARGHGATDAQIEAARRCLTDRAESDGAGRRWLPQ